VPEARIVAVAGDEANLKITTPADLALAEQLLAGTSPSAAAASRRR
jgi:2-C-methyl-D-erythritol 4-phosphate cytidylyltransferase